MKKLCIFLTIILSIGLDNPVSATSVSSCNIPLDGIHRGEYYYANDRTYNVLFMAQVLQWTSPTTFSGYTTEINTFRDTTESILEARISGTCTGNRISFVKTYLFEGGHSIKYLGAYNPSKHKITGRWVIPINRTRGGWELITE